MLHHSAAATCCSLDAQCSDSQFPLCLFSVKSNKPSLVLSCEHIFGLKLKEIHVKKSSEYLGYEHVNGHNVRNFMKLMAVEVAGNFKSDVVKG